jgi:hypothetical protein
MRQDKANSNPEIGWDGKNRLPSEMPNGRNILSKYVPKDQRLRLRAFNEGNGIVFIIKTC